jgi:hypothetical protein
VRHRIAPASSRGQVYGWALTSGSPGLGFLMIRPGASKVTLLSDGGCAQVKVPMSVSPSPRPAVHHSNLFVDVIL